MQLTCLIAEVIFSLPAVHYVAKCRKFRRIFLKKVDFCMQLALLLGLYLYVFRNCSLQYLHMQCRRCFCVCGFFCIKIIGTDLIAAKHGDVQT